MHRKSSFQVALSMLQDKDDFTNMHISLKLLVVKILERKLPSRLSLKMHCFAHTLLFSIHHCTDFKHYKKH